jgi:hypothetical protein
MTIDTQTLDQVLMTLWPKTGSEALAHFKARPKVPKLIRVQGQVYRYAETLADKLLALSVEIQDYDIPNLDDWTELANRMISALEMGKDTIDVGGKSFTAQQLYDTLTRVFKRTQEQHRQLWRERELKRQRQVETAPIRSRSVPEFYRDPELQKPVMEIKPPTTRSIAQTVVFRGATYVLVAAKDMGSLMDSDQFNTLVKQVTGPFKQINNLWKDAQSQYASISKFRQEALALLDAYKKNPEKLQADQKDIAEQLKPAAVKAFNAQYLQALAEIVQLMTQYYPNRLKQLNKLVGGSDQDRADAKAAKQQFLQDLSKAVEKFRQVEVMIQGVLQLNQQLVGVVNHLQSYQQRKEKDRQEIFRRYQQQYGGKVPTESITNMARAFQQLNQSVPQLFEAYGQMLQKIGAKYKKHAPAKPEPQKGFDPTKTVYMSGQPAR